MNVDFATMRSSVRFPLHLPVVVKAKTYRQNTETTDISSGGVLFELDEVLAVGSPVEFTISIPGKILNSNQDVLVNCIGRVVRCSPTGNRLAVAAIIDDYHFRK